MHGSKAGLGSEHPYCDTIQFAMIILFFAVWSIDISSHLIFGVSTIIIEILSFPLLVFPAILVLGLGIYLVAKSHETIFGESGLQPCLVDSGVYSKVRHPMYLGTLMLCLGFLFIIPSLLSLGIWVIFFLFFDKMATYEEKDLTKKLGDQYIKYKKRVGKWLPKI